MEQTDKEELELLERLISGKMCVYGDVDFRDCPNVKNHIENIKKRIKDDHKFEHLCVICGNVHPPDTCMIDR